MPKNKLKFGYTGCPNCTCWQAVLFRKTWLPQLNRCLCCGKIFRIKEDEFHEEKVGAENV